MAAELASLEDQITALRKQLAEHRGAQPHEPVGEYTFEAPNGTHPKLTDLFGDKSDLLVIHNMGKSCPYCTLWADGFNGLADHLNDRAAFVVASPDDPQTQSDFASSRGWRFRMVSYGGNSFAQDMGFVPEPGKYYPGVSAFHRNEDGSVVRTGRATFGPWDDFCSAWHLFGLLADGESDWSPKLAY